jgi:hypothetical protein
MASPLIKQALDFAVGILQIAEMHAMRRANRNASGIHSLLDAMNAEGAFIRITVRMDKARVIGAGSQAGFASHAFFLVDKDHPAPFVYVAGTGRTTINTGWIIAMVAAFAANFSCEGRISPCCFVNDPITCESLRHLIFGFAGHDTVHASHAFFRIDYHAVASHV